VIRVAAKISADFMAARNCKSCANMHVSITLREITVNFYL